MIPDVLFRFDKGVLNPALYPRLQEIVAVIGQKKFRSLEVVGHTDNKGTSVYNQQLSEQRAKAVADYLIAQLKLSPQIITIRGMGSLLPVSSNTTPAGRQRNRRVEIILLY
jgi:outer membrane protein OmpA-like peptidoglycan-associated protein